jgi:hypothetical protein
VNVYLKHSETGRETKIAVWYARSAGEDAIRARDAVAGYLDEDSPPEHLLVTETGVSVI